MALVKNLPQEMRVQSMDSEEGKKEMATHSSIFAWEIPWTEKPAISYSRGTSGLKLLSIWV